MEAFSPSGEEPTKSDVKCAVCNFFCIGYVTLPDKTKVGFCFIHAYPGILSPDITIVQQEWKVELPDGSQRHWTFAEYTEHVRKRPFFKEIVKEN